MSTEFLKLPDEIKRLATEAARHQGITTHAFMVEAIRVAATAAVLRARFVSDAKSARSAAITSGKGYRVADVHAYAKARAGGSAAPKPRATSWRGG